VKLMKSYFMQILGVISWGFLFIGVNGASSVQRSSDIGSLDAVMLNLELLCRNLVIFHCGVAG